MKAVMGEEEKHLAHFAPHLKEDFLEIRGSLTDYEVRLVKLDHDKLYRDAYYLINSTLMLICSTFQT